MDTVIGWSKMTYTRFTYSESKNQKITANAEQCSNRWCHTNTHTQFLTSPGRTGANHMCLPSWVLLTWSINLSGVLTSPLTLSSTFTLSGKAAMSGGRRFKDDKEHQLIHTGKINKLFWGSPVSFRWTPENVLLLKCSISVLILNQLTKNCIHKF